MERFGEIVNGWKPLTISAEHSILDLGQGWIQLSIFSFFSMFFDILQQPKTYLRPCQTQVKLGVMFKILQFFLGANHCVKSVRIGSFSNLFFHAFGLHTDQKSSWYGHVLPRECLILRDLFRALSNSLDGVFFFKKKELTAKSH